MSASEPFAPHGHLPTSFRRLQKNDHEQTTEQWKNNLLKETGAIAPLWTLYARSNQDPKVGLTRPREPLKLSDPDVMAALKQDYREAIALSQGTSVDEVPAVSSLVIWNHYQIEKERYDEKSDEYKRKDKEVNEIFPQENRKIFSLLERAMSAASVEDVKRTELGGAAYEQQDALGFLKAAIEAHDYVSPQISDRACQHARASFESYRQPPSATIPEHITEFRLRLEHCCKVRGDKASDIYKDFELKHLLITSLYEPTWGTWIRTC